MSRSRKGSAIAETGPALYLLLIVIFFPLMDLLMVGLQYCSGWYLNHEVTHELAVSRFQDWALALGQVQTKFNNTGIPNFIHAVSGSHTYTNVPPSANGAMPAQVNVQTSLTCKPFFYIPLPVGVVGVNQNLPITFTSNRMWETYNATDAGASTQTTTTSNFSE